MLAWLSEMKSALWPGVSGAGAEAGAGAPLLAICSEIEARLLLSAEERDSSSSSAGLARGLRFLELGEAGLGGIAGAGDFALLDRDRVAGLLDLEADGGHPLDRGPRFVAQALDPGRDRVVVFLDLAQVVGAGVDFRPARPIRGRR